MIELATIENKKEKKIKDSIAFFISKKVGKAIIDYNMLADGDKVAVAVSGGKDSLSLLHILNERRKFVPIKYDLLPIHIDLGYPCMHPKILGKYFEDNGYNYLIEKVDILKGKTRKDISCFWCAWNRRKAIFQLADKNGCSKIAFGHHKDDIVETILLNLFFQGNYSAMKPKQELFNGKITIIRPLAYVEEREVVKLAKQLNFPHEKCSCPNSINSQRTHVEKIIKELEETCPQVKTNIFRAIKRIKKDYLL
ncbi:MAG: ATP-binding protein [Candidatus Omnitrophota bacterium]|nr:ATP-binding protein [Candidatus Omnitrophota bacterium]